MEEVPQVTPQELKAELDGPTPPLLLDVREDEELAISRLSNAVHIRLADLPGRMDELDRSADIVVVCRSGARSDHATQFLLHQGFPRVRNLATGINGWARTVDPSLPVY